MSKLFSLLVLSSLLFSCTQNGSEQAKAEPKKTDNKPAKGPRKLETVKTSELASLMRKMNNELLSVKISIEGGYSFHDSLTFDYGNLHTAEATEAHMKKEGFDEFANAYLKQLEIFRNSGKENQKENYNLLVTSCLNCHASHCPGPVNKIKELKIKN